jgi:predicted nucleic acid-binding protein
MRFVLDASVVITWAMRDEDHPLADLAFRELHSGSVIVPGIWWYEIRNILVLNERRNRITVNDSAQFLDDLGQFSIEIDFRHKETQLMDLARRHMLSVYDAAYLALAMREKLPLATLDKALKNAALDAGVSLLGD